MNNLTASLSDFNGNISNNQLLYLLISMLILQLAGFVKLFFDRVNKSSCCGAKLEMRHDGDQIITNNNNNSPTPDRRSSV